MFFKIFLLAVFAIVGVMCDDHPTLEPINPLFPLDDGRALKKALEHKTLFFANPDEMAVINVLAYRTLDQRLLIEEQYLKVHNSSLITKLNTTLTGDFRDVILTLMIPREKYYPKQLDIECFSDSIDRIDAMLEILLSFENEYIDSYAYAADDRWLLLQYINSFTSSEVAKDINVSLFFKARDEEPKVNEMLVNEDVENMAATVGHWRTVDSFFREIFTTRSYPHLRKMFDVYANVTGQDIEQDIKSEFNRDRDGTEGYLAIVRYARNKQQYYAMRLKDAMSHYHLSKTTVSRIIVGHAESDLGDIMRYYKKGGSTLQEDIENRVSGDVQKLLLALVGTFY